MKEFECMSSLPEVLERCKAGFCDYTGQERVFSRDFSKDELVGRRRKMASKISKGECVLIQAGPPNPTHLPSQDATFYYFTGLEVLASFLVIDGESGRSTILLPSRDAMEGESGDRVGFEEADLVRERCAFEDIRELSDLGSVLSGYAKIYVPFSETECAGITRFQANGCAGAREKEEWAGVEPRHKAIIRKLKEKLPNIEIEDASAMVGQMRRIKSDSEIELLRQAGHLSALIMIEAMKATRPGMCESQLEAIAKYIYSAYGNCDLGYGVIGASGKRIVNGHYHFNNCTLKDGEVVLMDCGPDMRHYSSDICRIWPVSGTYSVWHRRIYGIIVEYHKELLAQIKPGIYAKDAYAEARAITRRDHLNKFFPNSDVPAPIDSMLKQGGPYNHCVGLSVHDFVGPWRDEIIDEGMVFVVDPMAMFPEEQQYIRIEDTIVVTSDGCEVLTRPAPIELDETEELMKQPSSFPESLV